MITEIKNTREGINSRITKAEERTSGLEDRMMEITADKQNKEKNEESLRDLWDRYCIQYRPFLSFPHGYGLQIDF